MMFKYNIKAFPNPLHTHNHWHSIKTNNQFIFNTHRTNKMEKRRLSGQDLPHKRWKRTPRFHLVQRQSDILEPSVAVSHLCSVYEIHSKAAFTANKMYDCSKLVWFHENILVWLREHFSMMERWKYYVLTEICTILQSYTWCP